MDMRNRTPLQVAYTRFIRAYSRVPDRKNSSVATRELNRLVFSSFNEYESFSDFSHRATPGFVCPAGPTYFYD